MRLRLIKKYGDSWVIKLLPADVIDYNLEVGESIDIDKLITEKNPIKPKKKK